VWLLLVAPGSLDLTGALVRRELPPAVLEAWTLADPLKAFRAATVEPLDPEAGIPGPAGDALIDTLGRDGLLAVAAGSLLL